MQIPMMRNSYGGQRLEAGDWSKQTPGSGLSFTARARPAAFFLQGT